MNTLVFPLITFAFSMCITPGPNNIMLTASGANFGFKRTIPHILGVEFGMIILFCLSAFGLGVIFDIFPFFQTLLKIAGSAYLFYLAWKIARSKRSGAVNNNSQPLSIYQAAAFQFLNPKAFTITITALSTFSQEGDLYLDSALLVILVFAVVCIPSITVWAGFGTLISRFLKNDRVFTIFNYSMAFLTAASVIFIIF